MSWVILDCHIADLSEFAGPSADLVEDIAENTNTAIFPLGSPAAMQALALLLLHYCNDLTQDIYFWTAEVNIQLLVITQRL